MYQLRGTHETTTYSSVVLSKHKDVTSAGTADQSLDWIASTPARAHKQHSTDLAPSPKRLIYRLDESELSGLLDIPDQDFPVVSCLKEEQT